ncbi:histidine kinase [Streptomyces sp. NPDC005805]|uniref:sensor histidine kinase n=1 Tax=Streptomyces sp. NPDC005805 TaxID=3157068 RepID=UPI0033CD654F
MRGAARALLGTRARLRWVHLVLGGALLMPFWLVGTVVMGPVTGQDNAFAGSGALQFAAYGVAVPLAAVAGLLPIARPLSVAAARALCGVPGARFAEGPARGRAARVRTAGWFALHLGVGALVSGASLALPPFAAALVVAPFLPSLRRELDVGGSGWWNVLLPLAGLGMLLALAAASAAAGALLANRAPVLLGPTPADRLAEAERRAAELAERNRLARELHDSVGHALSAVTLQAGAARRVLDSDRAGDREFVREALGAIEETCRRTVGELDAVLGLLRRDDEPPAGSAEAGGDPAPGGTGPLLTGVGGLVSRSGVAVDLRTAGDPAAVPAGVSREAYRIVQEGLSNALRHAGGLPVSLRIAVDGGKVEITMENALPGRAPVVRPGGGRGLRGVAERAALLGGRAGAGPEPGPGGGVWRLTASLPYGPGGPFSPGGPGAAGGAR